MIEVLSPESLFCSSIQLVNQETNKPSNIWTKYGVKLPSKLLLQLLLISSCGVVVEYLWLELTPKYYSGSLNILICLFTSWIVVHIKTFKNAGWYLWFNSSKSVPQPSNSYYLNIFDCLEVSIHCWVAITARRSWSWLHCIALYLKLNSSTSSMSSSECWQFKISS